MDYLKLLKELKDKIFHIHFKDIKLFNDKIDEYGVFTYLLSYMQPKITGEGRIDWQAFIEELKNNDYQYYACVEVEDKDYEDSFLSRKKAIENSYNNLINFFNSTFKKIDSRHDALSIFSVLFDKIAYFR